MLKRIQYNAPVTLSFALISLAALLLSQVDGGWANTHLFSVYRCAWGDLLALPRLFLHVLGHASYSHYLNNMLLILALGPGLEDKYGSRSLLLCILITAFVTGGLMVLGLKYGWSEEGDAVGKDLMNRKAQEFVSQLSHILGGLCGGEFGFLLPRHKIK